MGYNAAIWCRYFQNGSPNQTILPVLKAQGTQVGPL